VPAGPPILLLFSLRAVVLGGRRSLHPLSFHSPFMVSFRMADNRPKPKIHRLDFTGMTARPLRRSCINTTVSITIAHHPNQSPNERNKV
jgi:hypothetical protein